MSIFSYVANDVTDRSQLGRSVEQAARRSQDRARLLPGHRAGPVRADLRVHRQAGLLPPRRARRDRKAARARPQIVDRDQRRGHPHLQGRSGLPHRSLSRQRDGAEPAGAALCQYPVRAGVELDPYRPRADHRGRNRSAPARAAITTRAARCATWCRTTCCSCSASSPWSRRPPTTPTRCATKSSRCCAR